MWKVGPSLAHTSPHHESTRMHTPLIPDSRPFGGGLASSHIWFDTSGKTVLQTTAASMCRIQQHFGLELYIVLHPPLKFSSVPPPRKSENPFSVPLSAKLQFDM